MAELRTHRDIAVAQLLKADLAGSGVTLDKFADQQDFVVVANIKIGLHALSHRLAQTLPLHLYHDRKWKPLKQGQFLSVVVAMVEYRDPDVHSVVCVLAVDLVKV